MIGQPELAELDSLVDLALAGRESRIKILGYGEISTVLGWPADSPTVACKRLPLFSTWASVEKYKASLLEYVDKLTDVGVPVVPTEFHAVERADGRFAGYCTQPVVPGDTLGPGVLAAADPQAGHPMVGRIVQHTVDSVKHPVGFDAQVANWSYRDGELSYFDVTTPLLLGPDGRTVMEMDLFLASAPWIMRGALKRFVIPQIVTRFHTLRTVLLDLCANLIKERLTSWIPAFLQQANRHLDKPIGLDEVHRDYRNDARLWELMQRLRRADRFWQRRVRRRVYPFLLPGKIAR